MPPQVERRWPDEVLIARLCEAEHLWIAKPGAAAEAGPGAEFQAYVHADLLETETEKREGQEEAKLAARAMRRKEAERADSNALQVRIERDRRVAAESKLPTEDDCKRLKEIAYGLETGYFHGSRPEIGDFTDSAADFLRKLANEREET